MKRLKCSQFYFLIQYLSIGRTLTPLWCKGALRRAGLQQPDSPASCPVISSPPSYFSHEHPAPDKTKQIHFLPFPLVKCFLKS